MVPFVHLPIVPQIGTIGKRLPAAPLSQSFREAVQSWGGYRTDRLVVFVFAFWVSFNHSLRILERLSKRLNIARKKSGIDYAAGGCACLADRKSA